MKMPSFIFLLASLVTLSWSTDPLPAQGQAPAPAPRSIRAAAVQMRSVRNIEANLKTIATHLERCAREGVRVVVFPECALTGYFDAAYMKGITAQQIDTALERVADLCRSNKIYAVLGSPYLQGDKLYNSAFVINPEGKILERYDKIHLAEAWPVGGSRLSVFKIDGVPCSIIVCHDERYPELVRLPVLAGARVVFYVSHESGIDKEHKINPYRAQIQARAVENTVFIVQANAPANKDATGSHGQSRIIAPDGNLVQEASIFDEEAVTATLDLTKATGHLARLGAGKGPLQSWWREGVKQVKIVD